jgi:hypothetical protein
MKDQLADAAKTPRSPLSPTNAAPGSPDDNKALALGMLSIALSGERGRRFFSRHQARQNPWATGAAIIGTLGTNPCIIPTSTEISH